MTKTIEVKVPDIGDFKDVAVIEVLVKPGDVVKTEQSLITVESDKASMEIPSSHAGVVKDIKVKLGDKVREGTVVLTLEASGATESGAASAGQKPVSDTKAPESKPSQAQPAPQIEAARFSGTADLACDVLVLGGGPVGENVADRAVQGGLTAVIAALVARVMDTHASFVPFLNTPWRR